VPAERAPGDGDAVLQQQHQLAGGGEELLGRVAGELLGRAAEQVAVAGVVLGGELGEQRCGPRVVRVDGHDLHGVGGGGHAAAPADGEVDMGLRLLRSVVARPRTPWTANGRGRRR
jgi:hypothetical protein